MEERWEEIEPQTWKPEAKNDSITGRLIKTDHNVGSNDSTLYHIQSGAGNYMVWGATVLDQRMGYIKVGDKVRITYKGKTTNQKGQPLKIFKVERPVQSTKAADCELE